MKRILVGLLLCLASFGLSAKDMAKATWDNITITLTNEACSNPKMVEVHSSRGMRTPLESMKRARIVYFDRTLEGCWADLAESGLGIGVVDEDGDSGIIDKDQFKPVEGV